MDYNRIIAVFAVIGIICCIYLSFTIGRKNGSINIPQTKTIVDTVFVNNPDSDVETIIDTVFVKVPVYFTGTGETDEVEAEINVEIERREYSDSLYKAVIVGPKIENYSPRLEMIDLYIPETVVNQKKRTFKPYVSACASSTLVGFGGGVRINDRVDVGIKYVRVGNKNGAIFETSITF